MAQARTVIPTVVSRRIDASCADVGFAPPPCRVHLKFLPRKAGWTLVCLGEPGTPSKVARWMIPYGPTEVNIAPGLAPRVLRANFDVLPSAWSGMLAKVKVHYLELTPEGSCSIFVADSLRNVQSFIDSIRTDVAGIRQRTSVPETMRIELTGRQLEVLALAVSLGYYDTPHRVSLRAMAKKLGLSVGATSELLRRGEALLITGYVDAMSASVWKGHDESF